MTNCWSEAFSLPCVLELLFFADAGDLFTDFFRAIVDVDGDGRSADVVLLLDFDREELILYLLMWGIMFWYEGIHAHASWSRLLTLFILILVVICLWSLLEVIDLVEVLATRLVLYVAFNDLSERLEIVKLPYLLNRLNRVDYIDLMEKFGIHIRQ